MLLVQVSGLRGCVGRIKQGQDGVDWSQDTASAGESRPSSSDSSEWLTQTGRRLEVDSNASCGVDSKSLTGDGGGVEMRASGRRVKIREWSKTDVESSGAKKGQMNSCEAKQGLRCLSEGHVDKVEEKHRKEIVGSSS